MIKILNNLPTEYDVILDGLETRLKKIGDEALTLEEIHGKLGSSYEQVKAKK